MSKKTTPRQLKLGKYPKGIFKWKIALELAPYGSRRGKVSHYSRYFESTFNVPTEVHEYLRQNASGRFYLRPVSGKNYVRNDETLLYDALFFENKHDVMMFKLVHPGHIRNIYEIIVDEKSPQ